ncbi:phage terminase large subunit [Zavarzinia sp.]|uniref:phage terminase large subunit n=1 Tax=Zavarzinia sp. TaxID=2027920 RepID=UPI003BB4E98B
MAKRRLRGLTKAEFRAWLGDQAGALRKAIETEVTGLDESPAAIADRRAKALAPDGFEYFCRTYFPHYVKSPSASRLHQYLFKRLPEILADPAGQNDVIAAPRGEAKSTFCTQLFPLWCIARRAKHYILVLMDAFDQAAVMVEAIKAELEANPRLALDFPEMVGAGRVWKEGVIVTKAGIKVQGFGSGKRLRGLRHGPHRPDLAVLDDIENDENVKSPEQRDKLEAWVDKAVLNVGAADGTLDVIYIGTTLHYDGVLMRKVRNPLWRAIKFASIVRQPDRLDLWEEWEAVLRNDGPQDADAFYAAREAAMNEGAIVSWPEVRPLIALMKLKVKIGQAAFDSEQQNDPISSEDALFGSPVFWVSRIAAWVFFGSVDPSLGKANRSRDPSAILVGGLNRETGVLDVIEASIRRRLPDRIIEDVIGLEEEFRCLRWAVESVQFQEFFRTELVKRSAARRIPVPAVPVIPFADKALRIERLQPHVGNGLIRFNQAQRVLLDQLRHYPMVDHDDGLDALEMLWSIALGAPIPAIGSVAPRAAVAPLPGGRLLTRRLTMFGRR